MLTEIDALVAVRLHLLWLATGQEYRPFLAYAPWSLYTAGADPWLLVSESVIKIVLYAGPSHPNYPSQTLTCASSSSHRSSWRSMANAARFGKCLKNFPINCDARRFSFADPLTASNISRYSSSCYEIETISERKQWNAIADRPSSSKMMTPDRNNHSMELTSPIFSLASVSIS